MPDCEDLKQQNGESLEDYIARNLKQRGSESMEHYIARLKSYLGELFEQHIAANENLPLFASDIKNEKEREDWKKSQLIQWTKRHNILRRLVELGEREREEITWHGSHEILRRLIELGNCKRKEIQDNDFRDFKEYLIFRLLELRQRWLTPEGAGFLKAIIDELKRKKNRWDSERKDEEPPGLDFSSVTKFTDFYYVHGTEERKYRDLRGADLWKQEFPSANLQGADLSSANLQEAILRKANLQETVLNGAELQGANLRKANFREAFLFNSKLQGANLSFARLLPAALNGANLQGADFDYAVIAGPVLKRSGLKSIYAEREIDDRSANFIDVEFSREWRGPRWTTPIAWALHLGNKELAWRKLETLETTEEKKTEKNRIIRLLKSLKRKWKEFWASQRWYLWIKRKWNEFLESPRWHSGRPTTFFGVDTSRMDGSKNPGLKRYIEDEQYIEDFKEKHRVIYWLWAMSSDCGRCLSLWAFWSIVIAGIFGFLYAGYDWMPQDGQPELTIDYTAETTVRDPVTGRKEPLREKTWFTPYYYSIVTFTTLGFGDVKPKNLAAEIWLTFEVVLGYFFLGGLVAILASKLARRA